MAQTFEFVSALAIGWIPYHRRLEDILPPNAYCTYAASAGSWRRLACDLLFYSGNQVPNPLEFKNFQEFAEFLKSKNYRGALALQNVRLHCLDNGNFHISSRTLDLKRQEHIGYTPLRLLPGRRDLVFWYAKGQGECKKPRYVATHTGVRLSHEVTFRIGRLGNIGAKILTGYWAPDVWMRVDYDLNKDGSGRLHISGSLIPSQCRYLAEPGKHFSEVHVHNMEKNNLGQVEKILEAGPGIVDGNYYRCFDIQGMPCA